MKRLIRLLAFANTQGGRLLFGVANDGSLVGLADAQGDAEFISKTKSLYRTTAADASGKSHNRKIPFLDQAPLMRRFNLNTSVSSWL